LKTVLKAIVLKTSRLRETQDFFETTLGVQIEESSISHFVFYAKGIRILFVSSKDVPVVELYFNRKKSQELTVCEDPNQNRIFIS